MRYSISSNFENLSMNREKSVSHWEKWNFGPKGNCAHTAHFLALGKPETHQINFQSLSEKIEKL